MSMYRAMRQRFGPRHWWPICGDGDAAQAALEICVGAILTQNTSWTNVEKALANLHATGCMGVRELDEKSPAELAELIHSAGYFNVKARRLKHFVAHIRKGFGQDVAAFLDRPVRVLRAELLSLNGIGLETADCMILYAAGKPTFVVDAYTRRVLSRHGLAKADEDYEVIRGLFETSLPRSVELWNDFHAQFVAVGKYHCRPTARCEGCPLRRFAHTSGACSKSAG